MLENQNSVNNSLIKSPIVEKKFISQKLKKESFTPKLPTIKRYFPEIINRPLSNNNDIDLSNSNLKNKIQSGISSLVSKRTKDRSFRSFSNRDLLKSKNSMNFSIIKNSSLCDSILHPKKMPNIMDFHRKMMRINIISCKKSREEFMKREKEKENKKEDDDISELLLDAKDRKVKTGIYGPNDNIVSVIRAKMERLKYDKEYRKVDEELKELIKDEIMDAQVKLKRKPEDLIKKSKVRPMYLKKMDKYRYLSKMNVVKQINPLVNTPVIVDDGELMLKLINEAFYNFKIGQNK